MKNLLLAIIVFASCTNEDQGPENSRTLAVPPKIDTAKVVIKR